MIGDPIRLARSSRRCPRRTVAVRLACGDHQAWYDIRLRPTKNRRRRARPGDPAAGTRPARPMDARVKPAHDDEAFRPALDRSTELAEADSTGSSPGMTTASATLSPVPRPDPLSQTRLDLKRPSRLCGASGRVGERGPTPFPTRGPGRVGACLAPPKPGRRGEPHRASGPAPTRGPGRRGRRERIPAPGRAR